MQKSAIAVQEISSGIAAAGDRGYNGLEFPRSATAATKERTARVRRGRRERSARNTNLMHIELDDLSRPEIAELLKEHLVSMFVHTPPESVHALPIEGLRSPDITFWSVWENDELLGCGALKELDPQHGEIKSMRTASHHRGSETARISALEFGDRLNGCLRAGSPALRRLWLQLLRTVRRLRERPEQCLHDAGALIALRKARCLRL